MNALERIIPERALSAGYLFGFLLCIGLLASAYYFEYALFLEPCPLCIVQRIATLGIGLGCLFAFFTRNTRWPLRLSLLFTLASSLFGLWVANHHVSIQNMPASEVPECGPGLEYMIETLPTHELITTVLRGSGSCADVSWVFLGFTMPEWTCFAFIGFALIVLLGLARTWKTDKA